MFHPSLCRDLIQQRLLAIALLSACASAQGETWVVTDHAHPVTNTAQHRVIVLDEQQRLEAYLTSRLPSDPTKAASTIQVYLASPEGIRLQHELTQAQQGITDAWSIGVEKIPAVVVDRRYVVYGEPDVAKAIALVDRARSAPQ
ncbi:TIGR03757 family integrating conjugative element protein [Pseudomonas graminis]|uniref:Integrating conjugative element protein, PFL_4709 family n=1 Tax=Pseudomonas graminis TaxID=158627 RepID=A0A1I0HC45_9PSED|nr:TIGR03757 family integrating conjugative element protein [Pseudomonas graminis]SET81373.1 integrating conjugative element protein, PFL_4709 family [Pseudomonas graminis]